jgi:hypothetical protein
VTEDEGSASFGSARAHTCLTAGWEQRRRAGGD